MPAPAPPIPQRIPPLVFRQPALAWTPAALALALGWPALALRDADVLMFAALIGGAVVIAASLVSLGGAWFIGLRPRTHRDVVVHFLMSGAVVALVAPFALSSLLDAIAAAKHAPTGLDTVAPYALIPLALLIGLPIAFFYGVVFALVALEKPGAVRRRRDSRPAEQRMHDAQPFI